MSKSELTRIRSAESIGREVAESLGADIYLLSGTLDNNAQGEIVAQFPQGALLILVTYGGRAEAAYRIAKIFLRYYQKFSVLVPSYCKSAGTLLALGAHELIMTPFGELGPLDVQLQKANELNERRSGLIVRSALQSLQEQAFELFQDFMLKIKIGSGGRVRLDMASEIAAKITTGLLAPIYGQVNPVNIGEDHRDLHVALEYGNRLANLGRNVIDGSVNRLVHDYPSHDFVIDIDEARGMFARVSDPTTEMYNLIAALESLAFQPSDPAYVRLLSREEPQKAESVVGGENGGEARGQAQNSSA